MSDYKMTEQETLSGLFQSCANGDLKEVKYYLTSTELEHPVNINAFDNKGVVIAIEYGYLDIIKYLLFSPDLKKHSKITDDCLFRDACEYGHINLIDFALTTSELNRKITLEDSIYEGLVIATQNGKIEVIQHFLESVNPQYDFDLTNALDKVLEVAFFEDHSHITQYINSFLLKKELDISLNLKTNTHDQFTHKQKL